MTDENKFIDLVDSYFHFLIEEFDFRKAGVKANGNAFYSFRFQHDLKEVSISYENISDYYSVTVYLLDNGVRPDYDDKTKTLHLDKLNKLILRQLSIDQIKANNEAFLNLSATSELERKMLKSAKELRLCLQHIDKAMA